MAEGDSSLSKKLSQGRFSAFSLRGAQDTKARSNKRLTHSHTTLRQRLQSRRTSQWGSVFSISKDAQTPKAEAMWRSGESVQKSLELLHEVYRKQPGLRRLVRTSLKSLINGVLLCRGEATLIQVKNLVLELAQPPHEDAVPLSILWGQCILSEWFADQQVSVELANVFRDNPNFKKALESRVDAVVGQALTKHQVDAVYRVIETLLRLFMNEKAQTVLGNLFDYKYVIGDKRGCEAILDLCDTTDLDIGSTRRKQFENAPVVWLNRRNTLVPHKSLVKLYASPERLRVPKFKFKL
ncbi:uncharacterized protein LOC124157238 isoform X2 [Ischnura elegans]|uniref:uncharacterized protein LOC124157238 isoform X2 n=1 Tax=Ischnura elegans TaxID=197161 RepID=UPI001ED88339|nr:uncharacterized protein LOC124157238 isoform X2 [Ischnura elegans]